MRANELNKGYDARTTGVPWDSAPGVFTRYIAAHHFFDAEIAHEIFE